MDDINNKNTKINRYLLFSTILSLIILVILIFTFNSKLKVKEKIIIQNDNCQDYIVINPLYAFDMDNQKLTITSTYSLNNKYEIIEELEISLVYTINFYYYKTNNLTGIITYYNRIVDIEMVDLNDDLTIMLSKQICVEPKQAINDYFGLKTIEVKYDIISSSGEIKRK